MKRRIDNAGKPDDYNLHIEDKWSIPSYNQWAIIMKNKGYSLNSPYDYKRYYKENPLDAWNHVINTYHFPDTYKLPSHPTFSDESIYSNSKQQGGSWMKDSNGRWLFKHSPYTAKHLLETANYLGDNVDFGDPAEYAYYNGEYILPTVNIKAKRRKLEYGGKSYDNPPNKKYKSYRDYYEAKQRNFVNVQKLNNLKYAVPIIPEKMITLRGNHPYKDRGASFSENLLDSIYVNSKRAGIPFSDALGVVAQESTFGNDPKRRNVAIRQGYYDPVNLTSDWAYYNNSPYNDAIQYAQNKSTYRRGNLPAIDNNKVEQLLKNDFNYTRNKVKNTKFIASPFEHSFRYFKTGNYNRGDRNYNNRVKTRGRDIIKYSPEVQSFIRKRNIR